VEKRQRAQLVVGVVATAIATAFALSNSQRVTVDWLVTSSDSRLIYVIVSSLLVGGVVGYVLARRPGR
jgi:uncharacterized integral membrane protein